MTQQAGQKLSQFFFDNYGGINLSDSFLKVKDNQAIGGYNYEYTATGGITKSLCPERTSSSPDSALRSSSLALKSTKESVKSIIRTADRKFQLANLDGGSFSNLTEDTASAPSDIIPSGNTSPVLAQMFVQAECDVLWHAGGTMQALYGAVSDTKVTKNGADTPTGAVTASVVSGSGQWVVAGKYYYSFALKKLSTGALSNAALDVQVTTSALTDKVVLNFSGLTGLDATKYSHIYIFRSALSGALGFTVGDLVTVIPTSQTTYIDTGLYSATAVNVPRSGNVLLDNGVLPSGSYNSITAFKRRLVTAKDSTVYLSDLNKPESWPLTNSITIPSGGKITALAVIGYATDAAPSTDEYLAIFKENECWIITGNDYTDWALKFVDRAGTIAQNLVVSASGYLYFVDNRGIYIWDGAGKPMYVSRIIENLFGVNGKLDKAKLPLGQGIFFRRQNEVVWFLSHVDIGEQQFIIKLDLRNTLTQIEAGLIPNRIMDGCFLLGKVNNPVYAAASFIFPTSSMQEDVAITGDDAGYVYRQFYDTAGVGANDYDFTYETKFFDMGRPRVVKRYEKVIAWVENLGNWDLTLDYWTDFRYADTNKNSVSVTINPNTDTSIGLWDIGAWDVATWDGYSPNVKPIVFNLTGAPFNNGEGEVLKLRFRNQNSNQPILIYGFGVIFSEVAMR